MRRLILLGLLSWGWSAGAWAESPGAPWARFRGPNGTGRSEAEHIPSEWTERDLRWQVELPGTGHSSPVIWGERIFLTSASDDGTRRHVLCLRTSDGQLLWKRDYDSTKHTKHELNSFASPTPAADGERVYVSWSAPEEYTLLALTHAGQEVWRQHLGTYTSQHSAGPSPIVYRDLVILGNEQDGESSVVAVDAASGQLRWQTPRRTEKVAYSTPCIFQPSQGADELILLSWAHGVASLDPLTGEPNWELKVFDKRTVSSPILGDGLIFGSCGSGGGGNYVAAVRPGNRTHGTAAELAYKLEKSAPYVPTGVYREGHLYLLSEQGVATNIEAASGAVVWQQRLGGKFFGSPICVQDRLYAIADNGDVAVWRAGPTFEKLGRVPLGEASHSTPAVADGVLYLRTESHLFAVGGPR